MSLTETIPLDHWTNFFKLAQMGMLRLDQLFQKSQSLVDQGHQAEAVQLYLAYINQPKSEKWPSAGASEVVSQFGNVTIMLRTRLRSSNSSPPTLEGDLCKDWWWVFRAKSKTMNIAWE